MELKPHIIIALLASMLFSSCEKDQWNDCFTSTGSMTEEIRTTEAFSTVEIYDRVDLVLEEGNAGSIVVRAGKNLLGQVETNVVDGKLIIENKNTCNWVRSFQPRITVRVPVSQVAHLDIKGTGNISSTSTVQRSFFRIDQNGGQGNTVISIDVDTCFVGMYSGAGNVSVTGSTYFANLYSNTMGPINAIGLDAEVLAVNNSGNVDIRCRASSNLNVEIYGVGDIYYAGEPLISTNIVGSGQLIKVE